jgi:hypothetical protein
MTTTTDGQTGKQRWRDRVRQTTDRGREVYEESWLMRLASWVIVSGLMAAMGYVVGSTLPLMLRWSRRSVSALPIGSPPSL